MGFSCLLPNRLSRSCVGIVTIWERGEKKRGRGISLVSSRQKEKGTHHFLTHSQLFARILFVVPVIYLFVFLSFFSSFLSSSFSARALTVGKRFSCHHMEAKGVIGNVRCFSRPSQTLLVIGFLGIRSSFVLHYLAFSPSTGSPLFVLWVSATWFLWWQITSMVLTGVKVVWKLCRWIAMESIGSCLPGRLAVLCVCVFLSISVREKHREIIVVAVFYVFVFWELKTFTHDTEPHTKLFFSRRGAVLTCPLLLYFHSREEETKKKKSTRLTRRL